jgi:hypothetical protein
VREHLDISFAPVADLLFFVRTLSSELPPRYDQLHGKIKSSS